MLGCVSRGGTAFIELRAVHPLGISFSSGWASYVLGKTITSPRLHPSSTYCLMKSFVTFILLCILTSSRLVAQTSVTAPIVTTVDGKARIEYIVPALGEQDALFLKGKDWLYKTYNSGKTVEQYDDKAAGRIAVKARTQELKWNAGLGIVNTAGCFTYSMTLDFKEGKSRLIIENITYQKGQLTDSDRLKTAEATKNAQKLQERLAQANTLIVALRAEAAKKDSYNCNLEEELKRENSVITRLREDYKKCQALNAKLETDLRQEQLLNRPWWRKLTDSIKSTS